MIVTSKPFFLGSGGIILGFLCLWMLNGKTVFMGSELVAIPNALDLGKVESSPGVLHRQLYLQNVCDEPLIITKVDVMCPCTTTDIVLGTKILPRSRLLVNINFSIDNRTGNLRSAIIVSTLIKSKNLTANLTVDISAIALTPAFVEPKSISFDVYSGETLPVGSISIKHGNSPAHAWDDLEIQIDDVKILSKVLSPDGAILRFAPDLNPHIIGSFNEPIRIFLLNHGKRVNFRPFIANVLWEMSNRYLAKAPAMVYLGIINHNEIKMGKIILRSLNTSPIRNMGTMFSIPVVLRQRLIKYLLI
jgi:hypothetical protein